MDLKLAVRAGAVQGVLIGTVFLVLVVLPFPAAFFASYGFIVGPLAWLVCAVATTRILRLGARTGALATVASGAVAVLVGLLHHDLGTVAAVVTFGAVAGAVRAGELRGRAVAGE
jgi:hypothetical protein